MEKVFIYTRSIEIIIAILVGAFLSWLGYRLFQFGFTEKSDLNLNYGKIKFHLLSTSPGIFFSLFGTILIFISVWRSAQFKTENYLINGSMQKISIEKSLGLKNYKELTDRYNLQEKFDKALLFHYEKNYDEAKFLYDDILKSLPLIGQVSNNLADIYKNENKLDMAIIFSTFATQIFPDSIIFQNTLRQVQNKLSNEIR